MKSKTNNQIKTIAKAAFPDYRGRKFSSAIQSKPIDCRSCWEEGSRKYFTFVRMDTLEVMSMPAQSAYDKPVQNAEAVTLPAGCACVVRTIYRGTECGLFVYLPGNQQIVEVM